MGLGRFFQALQQVQAIAQIRKARRSHPSLQKLEQDPMALRAVSLLSDDVSMLPSVFEALLVALTQRACEFEKRVDASRVNAMEDVGSCFYGRWGPCGSSMDEGRPGPALHRKHGSTGRDFFRPHTHRR